MAEYTVTYSCGHTDREDLYGPHKDRYAYVERARDSMICNECYRAAKEQAYAAQNQASAAVNLEAGLPPLHGTPRQIAWAETIRRQALESASNEIRPLVANPASAEQLGVLKEEVEMYVAAANDRAADARKELESQTDAAWWIDHQRLVDRHVRIAQRKAFDEATADLRARLAEERVAREERTRQEDRLRREAEAQARADEEIREVVRARSFHVGDTPDSIEARPYRDGGDLVIRSRDGRTAYGFIDDEGEWVVYQIGSFTGLPSTHPEIERIAEEAKSKFEVWWSPGSTAGGDEPPSGVGGLVEASSRESQGC